MAVDLRLNQVANYLLAKGVKIGARNEWLQGCYNWCISSNANATILEIQTLVYEQWLLADLRDIGENCLPPGISQLQKTVLNGQHALQVNEFLDVGQSCYSQYQKIKKVSTLNVEVSDTKPQQWEPKSGRMLKLILTDGVNTIFGMEYKPIGEIREPLIPGLKVIITGPVECRRGVLLLEPNQIRILGGEADSLLIPNAVENVLARVLGLEENPNPYENVSAPANNVQDTVITVNNDIINHMPDYAANPNEIHENRYTEPMQQDTFFIDSDDDLMLCEEVEQIENKISQSSEGGTNSSENNITEQNRNTFRNGSTNNNKSTHSAIQVKNNAQSRINVFPKNDDPIVGIVCPTVPSEQYHRSSFRTSRDSFETEKLTPATFTRSSNLTAFDGYKSCNSEIPSRLTNDSGISSYKSLNTISMSSITKISDFLPRIPSLCGPHIIFVQGFVKKLTSKPRIHNNSWKLTAIICDDSESIEASFANQVLETIFGRTAAQMVADKTTISEDPVLKETINNMLKDGKRKLLSIHGRMKLEFQDGVTIPKIISIIY